jgi:glycosyltransferase involved in cell wall biosynthesis
MSLGPHSHTKCSLVIPVHNQHRLIYKHLTTLLDKVQNPIEIIIINDASTDNTHRQILDFFESLSNNNRHSIKYYKTRIPVYESRCDDFGIRISNSKYVIEIQADMLIHEEAFDEKLLNIMEDNTDYAILSCRGVTEIKHLGNVKNIIKGKEINDSIFMILYRNIGLRYLRKLIFRKIKLSPKNNPLQKSSGSQKLWDHGPNFCPCIMVTFLKRSIAILNISSLTIL